MDNDSQNSPFVILAVDENCTDEDVKQAYRRMAMRWHPDRSNLPDADVQFKRIQVAYQLLRTETGRNLVLNVARMKARRMAFRTPPPGASYQPGRKEFNPDAYSPAGENEPTHTKVFFLSILHSFLLRAFLIMRLERWPMNVSATTFFAMVTYNNAFSHADSSVGAFVSVLLLGIASGIFADFVISYTKDTNRYSLRNTVNNIVGYASIGSFAAYALTLDFGGIHFLPTLVGMEPDVMQDWLLFVLYSCFYCWFVFCFLFQKRNAFFEVILVWMWVFSFEFYYIVEIGI